MVNFSMVLVENNQEISKQIEILSLVSVYYFRNSGFHNEQLIKGSEKLQEEEIVRY